MTVNPDPSNPTVDALLQHRDFVAALARNLVGAGPDADDVAQEAWVTALEHPPRRNEHPRAWLATVTRNLVRMRWRGAARRRDRERVSARGEATPGTSDVAARFEIQSRVVDAVKALDDPYRTVVLLRYFDGLAPREIARRLDMPVATVKTRLRRALGQLRVDLDEGTGSRQAWAAPLATWIASQAAPAAAATTGLTVATAGVWFVSTRWKLVIALAIAAGAGVWWMRSNDRASDPVRRTERRESAERVLDAGDSPDKEPTGSATANTGSGDPSAKGPLESTAAVDTPKVSIVVTANGRAVSDATVFYVLERSRGPRTAKAGDAEVTELSPRGRAKFDGEAHAFLANEGPVSITASHHRFAPARAKFNVVKGEQTFTVELGPERIVQLRVVDGQDKPVAGARFVLLSAGANGQIRGGNERAQEHFGSNAPEDRALLAGFLTCIELGDLMTMSMDGDGPLFYREPLTSDAGGRIEIGGLPPGPVNGFVVHDDYVGVRLPDVSVRGTHVVRLRRGATITVIAPQIDGTPGAGAILEVAAPNMLQIPRAIEKLDDRGRAVAKNLQPGTYQVVVSRHGTTALVQGLTNSGASDSRVMTSGKKKNPTLIRTVTVKSEESVTVDFTIATGCEITGKLLDYEGKPLEETQVWLRQGPVSHQTTTDDQGRYRFLEMTPGRYHIFGDGGGSTLSRASFSVTAEDRRKEVDLRPGRGGVEGVVRNKDGQPMPGVSILASVRIDDGSLLDMNGGTAMLSTLGGRAKTDKSGRFSIRGLAGGRYDLLFGTTGTIDRHRFEIAEGEMHRAPLVFDASRLHKVRIRGVGADGTTQPIALAMRGEHGDMSFVYVLDFSAVPKPAHEFRVFAGKYRLSAHAAGYAIVQHRVIDVRGAMDVDLKLEPVAPYSLRVLRGGAPVAESEVQVYAPQGGRIHKGATIFEAMMASASHRTDGDGRVDLTGLAPGEYELEVDGQRRPFRLTPDKKDVVIEFE